MRTNVTGHTRALPLRRAAMRSFWQRLKEGVGPPASAGEICAQDRAFRMLLEENVEEHVAKCHDLFALTVEPRPTVNLSG